MICGVVLAAGRSTRMGSPKQLLMLNGRPLLQHVIDALDASGIDEIVVVLGHEADRIGAEVLLPPGARIVTTPADAPLSESLKVGATEAPESAEAIAVLLGDQPTIAPQVIARTIAAFRASDAPFARAYYRGVAGHPVVIDRSAFADLDDLKGDTGARGLMQDRRLTRLDIDEPLPIDVDTPDDFDALVRMCQV